ncbi:hypothetical protein [Legionella fallonii]|uniref:Uncharacterized protein n=1 Tax=Legionella fallonii LLAP-10 TaxID=1212491 RepID=A0A098G7R5_9GAMM|nr:hypothetical protein [Legionella fallonii]CEG58051.1 conserved protein of unknown function [Legionella fallonii LLAP-10]
MAISHSTSRMLARMVDKRNIKATDCSDVMSQEPGDEFDVPQLVPIEQCKPVAQPKPSVQSKLKADMGQALTNILGPNATKQHSPMDKKSG